MCSKEVCVTQSLSMARPYYATIPTGHTDRSTMRHTDSPVCSVSVSRSHLAKNGWFVILILAVMPPTDHDPYWKIRGTNVATNFTAGEANVLLALLFRFS